MFILNNNQRFLSYLIYLLPLALITGPFLSDFIISVVAIYFIIFSIQKKLWIYYHNIFFYLFIIFYIYILIRSLTSLNPLLSLESSLFYFRFIIFTVAMNYVINNSKYFVKKLYYFIVITLLILLSDTYLQIITGINIFGWEKLSEGNEYRVSSFFGSEYILGNYLVSFVPILLGLHFLVQKNKYSIFIFILIFFCSLAILFTGDRSSIFLNILSLILFLTVLRSHRLYRYVIVALVTIGIILGLSLNPKLSDRIVTLTYNEIGIGEDHQYIFSPVHDTFYRSSLLMIQDKPIFGHGPKMYREICKDKKYVLESFKRKDNCSTHPHNLYIQLLVETGIFGAGFLILFFIYTAIQITKAFYIKIRKISNNNKTINEFESEICFMIGIFISIWPLIPSMSFFNNWIAIILFLPVSFIYSNLNIIKSNK